MISGECLRRVTADSKAKIVFAAVAVTLALFDNIAFVPPMGVLTVPTPLEGFGYGAAAYAVKSALKKRPAAQKAPGVAPGEPPVYFAPSLYVSDRENGLREYGAALAASTDNPLMREKIAVVLAGYSVNH